MHFTLKPDITSWKKNWFPFKTKHKNYLYLTSKIGALSFVFIHDNVSEPCPAAFA